jgi:hypothetical protein
MEKENVQVFQVERGWWLNQADTVNKKRAGMKRKEWGNKRG